MVMFITLPATFFYSFSASSVFLPVAVFLPFILILFYHFSKGHSFIRALIVSSIFPGLPFLYNLFWGDWLQEVMEAFIVKLPVPDHLYTTDVLGYLNPIHYSLAAFAIVTGVVYSMMHIIFNDNSVMRVSLTD
jgi:hypothetical protein